MGICRIYDEATPLPELDDNNIKATPSWLPDALKEGAEKVRQEFVNAKSNPMQIRHFRTGQLEECDKESWHNHLLLLNAYNNTFVLLTDSRAEGAWTNLQKQAPEKLWSIFYKISLLLSPIRWDADFKPSESPFPSYFFDNEELGQETAKTASALIIQMRLMSSDIFDYPYKTKQDTFPELWEHFIQEIQQVKEEAEHFAKVFAQIKAEKKAASQSIKASRKKNIPNAQAIKFIREIYAFGEKHLGLNLYKELAIFSEILFETTYTDNDILKITEPVRKLINSQK